MATMGHRENVAGASGRGQGSVKGRAVNIFNFEGRASCPNHPALLLVTGGRRQDAGPRVWPFQENHAPRNVDRLSSPRVMNHILLRMCVFQTFGT